MHRDDPVAFEYRPTGHGMAAEVPTGQYDPTGQGAVQAAEVRELVLPKTPAGQLVHTPAPTKLYFPAKQAVASGDVDPAGHEYPALQGPLQRGSVRPCEDPYLPGSQGPAHVVMFSATLFPYRPT